MIGSVARLFDNILGRGDAAVTVPPLDGALLPNSALDDAEHRVELADVDCLEIVAGQLHASAGRAILRQGAEGWTPIHQSEAPITCIAVISTDGLAVATEAGEIYVLGGPLDGRNIAPDGGLGCVTAMASDGETLFVANGSASNPACDWQLDLMQKNRSGTIWRIELATGEAHLLRDRLAYPAGLAIDGNTLVCSEAWAHRLVRIELTGKDAPQVLHADLAGYPGRLAPAADGWLLAAFAPRNQLVEFVLREPAYLKQMIETMPRPYWIAPKLRSGDSFYEPLQGGAVKQLGMMKPWAPTLSAGLVVRLDERFQPIGSFHSRAGGSTHGITSAVEHQGRIHAASRGHGVVVTIDAATGEQP